MAKPKPRTRADLHPSFYTHDEVAALLRIHSDTLWHWRADGRAPPTTKISPRRTVFLIEDFDAWLKAQKRKPRKGGKRNGDQPPAA